MFISLKKKLHSQNGFTLVELMTVLIILGVILGIGVPKYLQVQAKAEWEADSTTIRNIVKAAETYAASINHFKDGVMMDKLIDDNLIDGEIALNRINGSAMEPAGTPGVSYKNEKGKTIAEIAGSNTKFLFNTLGGNVRNTGDIIIKFIGEPPYGPMPVYPMDNTIDEGA